MSQSKKKSRDPPAENICNHHTVGNGYRSISTSSKKSLIGFPWRLTMANRGYNKQSVHDDAVRAAKQIYQEHGKYAWINPDGEKNKSWNEYYIDVIAVSDPQANSAYVTEIETEDSVNDAEAVNQWKNYDMAYTQRWYLAVPIASKTDAEWLLQKHHILHCQLITWAVDQYGRYTFWGLPGL